MPTVQARASKSTQVSDCALVATFGDRGSSPCAGWRAQGKHEHRQASQEVSYTNHDTIGMLALDKDGNMACA